MNVSVFLRVPPVIEHHSLDDYFRFRISFAKDTLPIFRTEFVFVMVYKWHLSKLAVFGTKKIEQFGAGGRFTFILAHLLIFHALKFVCIAWHSPIKC